MPDYGDDMGQAVVDFLWDQAKRRLDPRYRNLAGAPGANGSNGGYPRKGHVRAEVGSVDERADVDWDVCRGDAVYTPGDADNNAVLVIGPVPESEMTPEQLSQAPTREMGGPDATTAVIMGAQKTVPIERTERMPGAVSKTAVDGGVQRTEPIERTERMPGNAAKAENAHGSAPAGRTERMPGVGEASDGPEPSPAVEKGGRPDTTGATAEGAPGQDGPMPDVHDDPRWISEKERALDSLGQSPIMLPLDRQKRECEAFARDLSRALDDAGIDHTLTGPDDMGRWSFEMSRFDVAHATEVVRGLGEAHDLGYVRNFDAFDKSAAYSIRAETI